MKKIVALLMVTVLAFGLLTACGQQQTPAAESAPPEAPAEPVTEAPSAETEAELSGDPAQPAGYPSKNVTCICTTAAGAGLDAPCRILADNLDLGKPVVVENLAGASQTIGMAECLNRAHDGYTYSVVAIAGLLTQPILNPDLGYTMDDFRTLCRFGIDAREVIAVKADSPIKTADDFIELIQSGEYTYGVANVAGAGQLAFNEFLIKLGVQEKGTEVIYNGAAEETAALVSGEIDFAVHDDGVCASFVENGDWRVVMAVTKDPNPYYPDVPCASDYVEDFTDINVYKIVCIPADTPDDVCEWLKFKMMQAITSEEYQAQMEKLGYMRMTEVDFQDEETLNADLRAARDACAEVMTAMGMLG